MLQKAYLGGISIAGVASLAAVLLVMALATPVSLGPLGVTAWFLLVLVALSSAAGLLAYAAGKFLQSHRNGKQRVVDSARRGVFVGSFATVSLALNSLQQLNARAVVLLVALVALAEFYAVARS